MKRGGIIALAVFAVATLIQSGVVQSQEVLTDEPTDVSLASYNDLLRRVQFLEEQQLQDEGNPFVDDPDQPIPIDAGGFAPGGPYGCAPGGSCGVAAGCCQTCCPGGYYALYENVIVMPHFTRDPAFFIDDAGIPAIDESWVEVPFDWNLEYSPRLELGYLSDCGGLGWRARWWHFDHGTTIYATDVDIELGFAEDPDIGIDQADANITATHGLDLDTIDLEMGFRRCNMTFSAGVRYGRIDQTYLAFTQNDLGVAARHYLEGIGPTLAFEATQQIRCGVSVFAKARCSVLYGESNLVAVDLQNNSQDIVIHHGNNDLLPIGELQFGIDWRRCMASGSTFFVTAAMEGQYWINGGTALPGKIDADDSNYHDSAAEDADLGFFGFNIGTGLIY